MASRKRVSQVIVVLAGYVSNRALDRLIAEEPKSVSVRDIRWLVDNFTSCYPQVFFDAAVVDFVRALGGAFGPGPRGVPAAVRPASPTAGHAGAHRARSHREVCGRMWYTATYWTSDASVSTW